MPFASPAKKRKVKVAASAGQPVKLAIRANDEYAASNVELRQFWSDVSMERLEEVSLFCVSHPKLLKYWLEHEEYMYEGVPGFAPGDGPLAKYVGLGNVPCKPGPLDEGIRVVAPPFRAHAMAVLYAFHVDVPDVCMDAFLKVVFSPEAQAHPVIARYKDAIKKRLADAAKTSQRMLERILYAAAVNKNLEMFQHFVPSKGKGTVFDVPAGGGGGVAAHSVLQAVLEWPDFKIRRDMASMVMTRSSTAYLMQQCLPLSAFAQAALLPEPEMLDMIIIRLRTDGVLAAYLPDVCMVACKVIQQQAASTDAPPAMQAAYAAVITQLVSLLDERHLVRLRGYLDTLRENATRCKLAADITHPLHRQAVAALDVLVKATACCVFAVSNCNQLGLHMLTRNALLTKAEEDMFDERYQGHLKQLHFDTETQHKNEQLRAENLDLRALVEQQKVDLQVVQLQARDLARLRRQLPVSEEKGMFAVDSELQKELEDTEAKMVQFLEDMELRLLKVRLPVAPNPAAPLRTPVNPGIKIAVPRL